jgi:hypothetical protein
VEVVVEELVLLLPILEQVAEVEQEVIEHLFQEEQKLQLKVEHLIQLQ